MMQTAPVSEGWHGTVVDTSGAAIADAHVYERPINTTNADAAVVHIADSDGYGHFVLPLEHEPKDVIIFATGFSPWVGFISAQHMGSHSLQVTMHLVACNYPGVNCDTFPMPAPHKKKH